MKSKNAPERKPPANAPKQDETDMRNAALIKACQEGDRIAEGKLYELYFNKLVNYCIKFCPLKQDAEDTAQDQFIKAFECIKSGKYPPDKPFEYWLYKCAKNRCINKFKRMKIEFVKPEAIPYELLVMEASTDEELFAIVESILKKEIKALPKKDRKLIKMKGKKNFSLEKIAKEWGKKANTITQRYRRIVKMLKKIFQKMGITEKNFSF